MSGNTILSFTYHGHAKSPTTAGDWKTPCQSLGKEQ